MFKVIINLDTAKSAKYIMDELEKMFPLLDGRIHLYQEPEIKPLNEVIKDITR